MAAHYTVDVEKIGSFVFRRRTMRDELRIASEVNKLTDGEETSEDFGRTAYIFACLGVLTVQAPDGWDLMGMDPLEQGSFDKVALVYGRMREREDFFRNERNADARPASKGDGTDAGVPVSASARSSAK